MELDLISKGSYSEVFYDHKKQEIYRRTPLFFKHEGSNIIDTSGITDLIFTKSFEYTGHTPIVHSETICEKFISTRMPYYGQSLHDWINSTPLHIRKKLAGEIIAQIIIACMHFEKNAFFHPDLKPTNILIETNNLGSLRIKIIDFNIASVKMVYNNDIGWTNTVGTWNYCAPEIIINSVPENNSSSWAIGIIASILIDEYTFSNFVNMDMQTKLFPQKKWALLFNDLFIKHPDHPPLSRWEWYEEPWQKLIWNCIQWNSEKRWTLDEIYAHIYLHTFDQNTRKLYTYPLNMSNIIHSIKYMAHIGWINNEIRIHIINTMFYVCKKIKAMYIFPTAVSIFDRCDFLVYNNEDPSMVYNIAVASMLLSSFIFDVEIITYYKHYQFLMEAFGLQCTSNVIEYIHAICKHLSYKLWEKPVHVIIAEERNCIGKKNNFWKYIKNEFLESHKYYTQRIIADHIIAKIS